MNLICCFLQIPVCISDFFLSRSILSGIFSVPISSSARIVSFPFSSMLSKAFNSDKRSIFSFSSVSFGNGFLLLPVPLQAAVVLSLTFAHSLPVSYQSKKEHYEYAGYFPKSLFLFQFCKNIFLYSQLKGICKQVI